MSEMRIDTDLRRQANNVAGVADVIGQGAEALALRSASLVMRGAADALGDLLDVDEVLTVGYYSLTGELVASAPVQLDTVEPGSRVVPASAWTLGVFRGMVPDRIPTLLGGPVPAMTMTADLPAEPAAALDLPNPYMPGVTLAGEPLDAIAGENPAPPAESPAAPADWTTAPAHAVPAPAPQDDGNGPFDDLPEQLGRDELTEVVAATLAELASIRTQVTLFAERINTKTAHARDRLASIAGRIVTLPVLMDDAVADELARQQESQINALVERGFHDPDSQACYEPGIDGRSCTLPVGHDGAHQDDRGLIGGAA